MNLLEILPFSLRHGLLLSALLGALLFAGLYINAEMFLEDYPPDIQRKFGPMSPIARRQRLLLTIPFVLITLLLLLVSILSLSRSLPGELTFLLVFTHTFIFATTFNLVDLIVLDWLIFVFIRPGFIVLPGTEGLAGYRDYGFHFRGFLVGIGISLVISAATAWFTLLIQTVLS